MNLRPDGRCSFCYAEAPAVHVAAVDGRPAQVCHECIALCLDICVDRPPIAPDVADYPPPEEIMARRAYLDRLQAEAFAELTRSVGAAPDGRLDEAAIDRIAGALRAEPRRPTPSDDFRCSFCDRARSDVAKLVSGPRVFVCDHCIAEAAKRFVRQGVPLALSPPRVR